MPETKLNTSKRLLAAGLTIGALSVVLMAPRIRAQTSASSESERQENLSAQSVERHQDVQRAVNLVAGIDGVAGVNNRLTWQKVPE
jgi:hypothetical protein